MTSPAPKHTSGPWTTFDLDNKREHPAVMGKGHCVATVWHNDLTRKACEANAHLIAAAPDLYAAVKAIEESGLIVPPQIWQLCKNALAKARGAA